MPLVGYQHLVIRRNRILFRVEELWPGDQGAGNRQLLLLTAGQVAAAAAEHVLQHREQREDFVRDMPQHARQRGEAGLQVLQHREARWRSAFSHELVDAAVLG
jgi:hypothetical protein